MIGRLIRWMKYGGSFNFRDEERELLRVGKTVLPAEDQDIFWRQVEAVELIQRSSEGRMILIHFAPHHSIEKVSNELPELPMAKVKISDGKKHLNAVIFLHRGFLSSIEYSKPPCGFFGKAVSMSVSRAESAEKGYSAQIDREEHDSTS